jgi:hypothetical protein
MLQLLNGLTKRMSHVPHAGELGSRVGHSRHPIQLDATPLRLAIDPGAFSIPIEITHQTNFKWPRRLVAN